MWNFPLSIGLATATLDFSTALPWAGAGLFGVVLLSAGMIVFTALRGDSTESHIHAPAKLEPISYQEAA
jgi:hypothetical protein